MKLANIKITMLKLSDTNPRGKDGFKDSSFDELVASIKHSGILMPVLVRDIENGYEVIAGNRRVAAASAAGLAEVPAQIVEMNDVEAREAQIVENLQRADIHPLEEAEAYRKLMEESKYTLEDVAQKVGKSVTYVRDRLVLTDLSKEGKKMFREGKLKPTHAALIARLDQKIQKEALEEVWDDYNESPMSITELREWIQKKTFSESLKNPPWKGDEQIQAALGGCDECQGKGGDLFGKTAAESCTNPKCYANRLAAFIEIKKRENPNLVSLTSNYSGYDDDVIGSGSYKKINSKKDGCDHEEKGIIINGYEGIGTIIKFCRAPECKKHWSSARPGGHYKPTPEERLKRKKEREADLKKEERQSKEFLKKIEKVKFPLSEKHLNVLLDLTFGRLGYSYLQPVASRHGIKSVKKTQNGYTSRDLIGPMKKWIKEGDNNRKVQFIFEIIMESSGGYHAEELKKI